MMRRQKKKLSDHIIENIILVASPILLLLIWQLLGDRGVINGVIMPTPSKIFQTFLDLLESGMLMENLWASMRRVLIGFAFGTMAGLMFGVLTGMFPKISKCFSAIFGILRPIPMIGMVPLMILWFGIGEKSKIIVIALGTFWPVLVNTQSGLMNIDQKFFEVARLLEKNRLTVLLRIIIPAATPSIFTGIRLGISMAWKSVIAAEMLAAAKGIGFMIEYARELAQPGKMFVGLLSIGFIGALIDAGIMWVQKKLIVWE